MCCSQHNPQYLDLIHQCCSRLDSRLFSEEDEQNSSETKRSRGEVVGIVQQTSDEGKKSFTFLSRCLTSACSCSWSTLLSNLFENALFFL